MKLRNRFNGKIVEFDEELDIRIWEIVEEAPLRKALSIQDFLAVRELKEAMRNKYQMYCR